jgi:AraC-like DNA-binding protein
MFEVVVAGVEGALAAGATDADGRLMLTRMIDAGTAGRHVGYASASQFTREYGRFFGSPPTKDIQRLREHGLAASEATPT